MELRTAICQTLLYGGITKEEYDSIGPVVLQRDRETLMLASAMSMVMFLALTVASFFSETIMEAGVFYSFMTVSCAALCALATTVARRRLRMVLPMWYLLYLIFGTYAVLLNTLIRPQISATTLCAFLVAAPLLIIDRPWRVTSFMGGLSLVFVVCAYHFKDPYLAFTDSVNVACCLFIGATIYSRLVRVRLREIMQARLLEKERDTDKLTLLLNKAAVEKQMRVLLNVPDRRGTLAIIDIDDFKHINDTYGHIFGDTVLRRTADCIRVVFPEEAILSGRFGGDEFLLFQPGPDDAMPERLNKLMDLVKREIELPAFHDTFTISAGTAVFPRDGEGYLELFRRADQALYAAKRAGKNCCRAYDAAEEKSFTF